jgi:hypothetical protein
MSKPWDGRAGWVWYESQGGSVPEIIALAKQYGMAGVFIKEADEGRVWYQTSAGELAQYRAAGIAISAWTYAYGENPEAAADAIIELAGRFDGVIIDAEAELRDAETASQPGVPNLIDRMLGRVREQIGWTYPLAVAPLPVMQYHEGLHYERWQQWGCDYLPQFYENVLPARYGGEALFASWAQRFDMAKVFPAYGAYGDTGYTGDAGAQYPTPAQTAAFEQYAVDYGAPGVSYWRLDSIKPALWPFGEGEPYAGTSAGEDVVSEESIRKIREELVTLIGLAGGQESAGDTGAGQVIRTCVNQIIAAYPPLGLGG